ncbi:MAG: hypothetical protein JW924_12315 [Fusobacteriaceae bacterium]|nr:hypothetical protein [Fusobacteriaceae bacterium]
MIIKVKNVILKEQNFRREDIIKGNIKFEIKIEMRIINKDKLAEINEDNISSDILVNILGRVEDNTVVFTLNNNYILIYENDKELLQVENEKIEEEMKSIIIPYIRESTHDITLKCGLPGLIIP